VEDVDSGTHAKEERREAGIGRPPTPLLFFLAVLRALRASVVNRMVDERPSRRTSTTGHSTRRHEEHEGHEESNNFFVSFFVSFVLFVSFLFCF
jgi:hypothetical protein